MWYWWVFRLWKLVDKLVDESTENIDKVKIAEVTLTENMRKCSSFVLYIKLVFILFTVNIWILKEMFLNMIMSIKQQIININRKY